MASRIPVSISFSSIANFLGTIGVIGSLVFVGLELRQSHQIALTGQIQARSERYLDGPRRRRLVRRFGGVVLVEMIG